MLRKRSMKSGRENRIGEERKGKAEQKDWTGKKRKEAWVKIGSMMRRKLTVVNASRESGSL